MSLRYEQYNALKQTRNFLRELIWWEGPMRKTEVRERASDCLHHFPLLDDQGEPLWSQDEFTKDRDATEGDNHAS